MSWEPPFSLGPGSAELPEGRRFLRMLQRNIRYVIGGSAIIIGAVMFLRAGDSSAPLPDHRAGTVAPEIASPYPFDESTGSAYPPEIGETYAPGIETHVTETPVDAPNADGRQIYAIALSDLPGLAPDSPPGTTLNLWVTWEPPVTRRPKVQLLLEGVTLERISPPLTIHGPYVANLLVTMKELPDLLYGDRFGKLNASLPPN